MGILSENSISDLARCWDVCTKWLLAHPRLALTSAAGGLVVYYVARSLCTRAANLPPGPRPLPFIGSIHLISGSDPFKDFERLAKQYGDVFTITFFSDTFIILNSYSAIREALFTDRYMLAGRPPRDTQIVDMNEEVFMENYSEKWKVAKKLGVTGIRQFGGPQSSMPEIIMQEVEYLIKTFDESGNTAVDTKPYFFTSMGIATSVMLFGIHYEDRDDPELKNLVDTIVLWYEMTDRMISKVKLLPEWIMQMFGNSARDRQGQANTELRKHNLRIMERLEKNRDPRNPCCLYDHLMSTRDLAEIGGLDRLADTLAIYSVDPVHGVTKFIQWALLYLAYFPDAQQRLQQLTDEVVGCGRRVHLEHRDRLGLVQSFLHEVQRHTSISKATPPRMTTRDNVSLRGYSIPRDAIVVANFVAVNSNPDVYPDPEVFKADRFIDKEGVFHNPPQLTPFGLGARICSGEVFAKLAFFLIISNLVHAFTIRFSTDQAMPSLDYVPGVFRSTQDYKVTFTQR